MGSANEAASSLAEVCPKLYDGMFSSPLKNCSHQSNLVKQLFSLPSCPGAAEVIDTWADTLSFQARESNVAAVVTEY